jgi:hypothetical protein
LHYPATQNPIGWKQSDNYSQRPVTVELRVFNHESPLMDANNLGILL